MQEEEKNLVEEQVEDGEVVELEMPEEEADESAPVEDVSEEEQAKDEDKDELENYSKLFNVNKTSPAFYGSIFTFYCINS